MADRKHPADADREGGKHPMDKLQCIDPEAVEDWELEAYINGETQPHVQFHLDECPACRTWLAEYLQFERRLREALSHSEDFSSCPSPHMLRDYYWGYLATNEQRRIDEHLEICPRCTQELNDLAEFLAIEKSQPWHDVLSRAWRSAERARLVLAHLVSPDPSLIPALRGETRDVLLFEAGDVALSINLEQDEMGAYTLFGQVLLPESSPSSGGYVRLTSVGMKSRQTSLDVNSGFVLPDLQPGVYQLVVHLTSTDVDQPGVQRLYQRIAAPMLALRSTL